MLLEEQSRPIGSTWHVRYTNSTAGRSLDVFDRILNTPDEPAVVLVRLIVGLVVFLAEGLQKLRWGDCRDSHLTR